MIEFEQGSLQRFVCGEEGELQAVETLIPVLKDTAGNTNLAAFAAIIESITTVLSLVCKAPNEGPENVAPNELDDGTVDILGTPMLVPISPEVEYVILEVLTPFPDYVDVTKLSGEGSQVEGRFGNVSTGFLGIAVGDSAQPPQTVSKLRTLIEMPRGTANKVVRISLLPLFSWKLYDTGVRTAQNIGA
jgi:hypothetical protein